MISPKILKILNCPACHADLDHSDVELTCRGCGKVYSVKENLPYLIERQGAAFIEKSSDVMINKLKIFFKRYPRLFDIVHQILGVSRVGLGAKEAIRDLGEDKIILNLGSGPEIRRKDVINIDFYPIRNVDVIADITKLPFRDGSADAVICEQVLEHVKSPHHVLQEMSRTLKSGGLVYIAVPFLDAFHSSPRDYYRWTKEGLRELMAEHGFKEKKIGVRSGPTSVVVTVVNNWLATVLSFNSARLRQILLMILMIVTSPLKILDYLAYRFRTSENIALDFYYLGEK